MKKTTLGLYVFLAAFVLVSSVVSASMVIPANQHAIDNSPVISAYGDLERVDFIHYAKPVSRAKPTKTTTCYKLMGIKWTSLPVSYTINTNNPDGLSSSFITSTFQTAAEKWDYETGIELFNNNYNVDNSAVFGVRDNRNVIDFGDYSTDGVIAVTSVWYSRKTKEIVEFDMRFDTDFVWGDARINPLLMDFQNIATHELGHSVGLSDLYTSSCSAVTMYGYSWEGDIDKRTLESPDIKGLQSIYGI